MFQGSGRLGVEQLDFDTTPGLDVCDAHRRDCEDIGEGQGRRGRVIPDRDWYGRQAQARR